jgi:hypothetical protein
MARPWSTIKHKAKLLLDSIEPGQIYNGWQDIEAGDNTQEYDAVHHSGIAKVVVQMSDYDEPYAPGLMLVKRICAIPRMIKTLRMIGHCENIYDCQHLAREILNDLGVQNDSVDA